jgi:hypothetical protein
LRQSVFLVPANHERVRSNFLQYRGYASAIGIHLNRRPWVGLRPARDPRVLGFDTDEIRIAVREALPIAGAGVVAPAGRDHIHRAITPQTKLSERAGEISPSVGHYSQARHVSTKRPGGVMADDASYRADIAASAVLPSRLFGHFQSGIEENARQPC